MSIISIYRCALAFKACVGRSVGMSRGVARINIPKYVCICKYI